MANGDSSFFTEKRFWQWKQNRRRFFFLFRSSKMNFYLNLQRHLRRTRRSGEEEEPVTSNPAEQPDEIKLLWKRPAWKRSLLWLAGAQTANKKKRKLHFKLKMNKVKTLKQQKVRSSSSAWPAEGCTPLASHGPLDVGVLCYAKLS